MSLSPITIADYRLELISGSTLKTVGLLDEAHGFSYALGLFGQGREGATALHIDSPLAQAMQAAEQFYVRVYRKGVRLRSFMLRKQDYGYETDTGKVEDYLELTIAPLAELFKTVVCLPDGSGHLFQTPELPLDDAFKWIVSHACGPEAYTSPGAASRVMAGLTVAAYESAHPTAQHVLEAHKAPLYDFLTKYGITWGVDWDLCLEETTGEDNELVFRTYVPTRGLDKTETNGVRQPVLINDASLNVPSARRHRNYSFPNAVVLANLAGEATDPVSIAAYGRREILSDSKKATEVEAQLKDREQREGWEFDFLESEQCQIIDHFGPGDELTINNLRLQIPAEDRYLKEVFVTLDKVEGEQVELTFGAYEATIEDQTGDGGGGFFDPIMGLTDQHGVFVPFSDDFDYETVHIVGVGLDVVGDIPSNTLTLTVTTPGLDDALFYGDDDPVVYGTFDPMDSYKFGLLGGSGAWVTMADHAATINTVWQLGTAPGEASLYPATAYAGAALALANDLYVYSDSIGGAQTFGVDSESGGVKALGWMHLGAMTTPAVALQITHHAAYPDILLYNGGAVGRWYTATGNLWLASTATTAFGGYTYTWPTTGAATGEFLRATVSGTAITLSWEAATGSYWSDDGTRLSPTASARYVQATRFEVGTADKYLSYNSTMLRYTSDGYHSFRIGATAICGVSVAGFYPGTTDTYTLGLADYRWSVVYGQTGNFATSVRAPRFEFTDTEYLYHTSGAIRLDTSAGVALQVSGASMLIAEAGDVRKGAGQTVTLGTSAQRWNTVYGNTGNFDTAMYAAVYYDASGTAYYLDLANVGTSLNVAGGGAFAGSLNVRGVTYTWPAGNPGAGRFLYNSGAGVLTWAAIQASDLPAIDHGGLTGLSDDDHTQYLLANGTRNLTGNLTCSAGVTIDGVDIGGHRHGLTFSSANTSDNTEFEDKQIVPYGSGASYYFYVSNSSGGGSPYWTRAALSSGTHHHTHDKPATPIGTPS